ncbi:DUF6119 family protein [Galbibacter sp.]|uniref:DUF6119 family protein n=1 Tax=Galbibacter sp. TaxID=2918471 RepID=UPI003A8E67A2
MAKSRSFSIFLLKENFTPNNSLKDDHSLTPIRNGDNTKLPKMAVMYISNKPPISPWWKDYWGINMDLRQSLKGALVFLKVHENWIALTFGSTYHQLKDVAFEYDFGIKTTLNALDPKKIKSTDILQPEDAKRQRIQSPIGSELPFFSLNSNEIILKKMTGSVKNEYSSLFKNITGGTNLRVSSNSQADEITGLCESLIEIYRKEDYKTNFPELLSIVPVKDPEILTELNIRLLDAFNKDPAPMELVLAIPDIFDYETDYKIKYLGAGISRLEFLDVYIMGYREYLQEKGVFQIEEIKDLLKHKLQICNENNTPIKEFSIYKSLLYDCEFEGNVYHLCEGEWYQIDRDFIQKLANELDPLFIDTHDYLHQCEHKREDDYNKKVEADNHDVICLDKQNISINGQYRIEPCDLIYVYDGCLELAHIKVSTRSTSLSHLFNQGVNSVELLRREKIAKDKLIKLVESHPEMKKHIELGDFRITYGIISKKKNKKSSGLPIFSRISLLRIVNVFRTLNVPVQVLYIYDNVDRKNLGEKH